MSKSTVSATPTMRAPRGIISPLRPGIPGPVEPFPMGVHDFRGTRVRRHVAQHLLPVGAGSAHDQHLFRTQFRRFPKDRFRNREPTDFMEQSPVGNNLDLFIIEAQSSRQNRSKRCNPLAVTPRTRVLSFEPFAPCLDQLGRCTGSDRGYAFITHQFSKDSRFSNSLWLSRSDSNSTQTQNPSLRYGF